MNYITAADNGCIEHGVHQTEFKKTSYGTQSFKSLAYCGILLKYQNISKNMISQVKIQLEV